MFDSIMQAMSSNYTALKLTTNVLWVSIATVTGLATLVALWDATPTHLKKPRG
jgi:hypothetical protein